MPGSEVTHGRVRRYIAAATRTPAAIARASASGYRASFGRLGRLGTALFAAAVLVLGFVVAVPLGGYDWAACKAADSRCPPPKGVRVRPLPRGLTPLEAATQGTYAALGDSYSSGEGAWEGHADRGYVNGGAEGCHRSGRAYAHAIARTHRFARGNAHWACSGATIQSFLRGQRGEAPQLDRINAGTSLITLSIGGNDVGFSGLLRNCIIKLPWTSACRDQDSAARGRLLGLHTSLRVVLDRVVQRAPFARVIVLSYPRLFPAEPTATVDNMDVKDQKWANGLVRALNDTLRGAVEETDARIARSKGAGSVEFVDAYEAFNGHEIGTVDPYMNNLGVDLSKLSAEPQSYHPNAAGYQRFAALIDHQIKAGPSRPIYQFR